MKHIVFLASALLANQVSIADESELPPVPTIEEKFYTDIVEPIVMEQCVSCHNTEFAYKNVLLDSMSGIIANKDKIVSEVTKGKMPAGNPDWKDTTEATTLLYWLAQQKVEVTPESPASF